MCTAIIVILCTCVVMKWVPFKLCQVIFFFLSWNPDILFLPMFQWVCHASLFYFKDQSGRQRKSGMCTKPGLPAFLLVGQLLLISACVVFTSRVFSSFHAHSQARFQTYTSHRCGSWSSRLHPGAGTRACAKQACTYVCANSIRMEVFLNISGVFFSSYW